MESAEPEAVAEAVSERLATQQGTELIEPDDVQFTDPETGRPIPTLICWYSPGASAPAIAVLAGAGVMHLAGAEEYLKNLGLQQLSGEIVLEGRHQGFHSAPHGIVVGPADVCFILTFPDNGRAQLDPACGSTPLPYHFFGAALTCHVWADNELRLALDMAAAQTVEPKSRIELPRGVKKN